LIVSSNILKYYQETSMICCYQFMRNSFSIP